MFLASIFTLAFFSIVSTPDLVDRQVQYNSGHQNEIAEAKLRADAYEERTKRELLYTSNIEALRLGNEEGGLNWEYNIPNYGELKQKYLSEVGSSLRTQNDVLDCSNPQIEKVEANSTENWYNVTLEEPWITCTSEPTEEGFVPTEATVNISRKYSITHSDNRYLEMANYSSVVTQNASWIIEEDLSTPYTADGSDAYCGHNSYPGIDGDTKRGARSDAKGNLLSKNGYSSIASDAYSNTDEDRPEFLEEDKQTIWPGVDNVANFEGPRTSYGECTYSCRCDPEDGCDTCTSTRYIYKYTYVPLWVDLNYHFEDSEERIINSEARLERLDFEFTHRHEVN
jgi:hypothetical protein